MTRRGIRHGCPRALLPALVLLALTTVVSSPGLAAAQSPSSGALEGEIRDVQGRPLTSVAISAISRSTGRRHVVRTDRRGRYLAQSLVPGDYDVLVERLGYHPERVEGVVIVAGEVQVLNLSLEAVQGDDIQLRVRSASGQRVSAGGLAPGRWYLGSAGEPGLPHETGDLVEFTRLSSRAGTRLDMDGLPARMHTLTVDGLPLAKRPRTFGTYTRLASLPLSFLQMADAGSGGPDVEQSGQAGALLSAHTLRGGPTPRIRAHSDFGSDMFALSSAEAPSFESYRAGGSVSGPIAGDTATFVLGVDYSQFRTPYEPLWAPGPATTAVVDAASQRDVDLSAYSGPGLAELTRIAAFGRLDAKVGDATWISVMGAGASVPTVVPFHNWTESPAAWQGNPEAREFLASAMLQTELSDEVASETSLSYERSEGTRDGTEDPFTDLPGTAISSTGTLIGSQERRNLSTTTWSIAGRQSVQVRTGAHHLKLGIAAQFPHYDLPWFYGRSGEYLFSGPDDLRQDAGAFRQVWGDDKVRANFNTRRITVFAQDTWRPRPGMEVMSGIRVSSFSNVDSALINDNFEWLRLSALKNEAVEQSYAVFEPRFRLTLKPASAPDLTLRLAAWVDADFADPGIFAEVIGNTGFLGIRRRRGTMDWPEGNPLGPAPVVTPALTMVGPEFQGPRTSRFEASLSRAVGGGASVSAGLSVRKTDHLPRRKDLNLAPVPTAADQHGRPIYGTLVKQGGLLLASPEANRRFTEFDQVFGIDATGESRYVGITAAAERPFSDGFGFWASYTWSKTEDDWLNGNPGDPTSQLNALPGSQDDWRDGRSDLDIPHRLLVGVEAGLPGRLEPRITALYRFQSGYPFTPGFRPGVDANADGSFVNDVAWVDQAVAGMGDLMSRWPCLQSEAGGFAERNVCRGPGLHSLDARLSLSFAAPGSVDLSFVVDAINLIATEDGVVDNALYLVDPTADLTVSPDGRQVNVPLTANPDFGMMLNRFMPQRHLRVGLRVGF